MQVNNSFTSNHMEQTTSYTNDFIKTMPLNFDFIKCLILKFYKVFIVHLAYIQSEYYCSILNLS